METLIDLVRNNDEDLKELIKLIGPRREIQTFIQKHYIKKASRGREFIQHVKSDPVCEHCGVVEASGLLHPSRTSPDLQLCFLCFLEECEFNRLPGSIKEETDEET